MTLEKLEHEDWEKVYYALVYERDKSLRILSVDDSIKKVKEEGIAVYSQLMGVSNRERNIKAILQCELNTAIVSPDQDIRGKYVLRYCEAKVYIYGKRYGCGNLRCSYDPHYELEVVKFDKLTDKAFEKITGRPRYG